MDPNIARWAWLAPVAAALILVPSSSARAQSPCGAYYTISEAQTLAAIAARCGTTVPALLAENPGLRSTASLEVGGTIRLPRPDAAMPTPTEACGAFYTVREIDTVAEIAVQCGLSVPMLLAVNPGIEQPDRLEPGGRIRIPDLPRTVLDREPADLFVADEAPQPGPAGDRETVRVEGVLESGGPCARLRTDDGRVVRVTGRHGAFDPGDRVVLVGLPVEAPECDGETLAARIVWSPS